ncbi:MAG: ABC transporter permease [Fusobacteriaceae bacterium]|nr:ABC transporter permease [Fusobacteriaceae bacterium]MBN2838248.1 ABC transporter permease [Fusobacteriaceae bacterium]
MKIEKITKSRIFLPLVILGIVILFNLLFNRSFFNITIKDGHFFGSLIDVLNRSTYLVLLAIGLTLVIATGGGGIDISVGAVVAISGAVAAALFAESETPAIGIFLAIGISLLVSMLFGAWNGILVAKIGVQPVVATLILMVAGRGIAQLITDGQILYIKYPAFFFLGSNGYILGLPFSIYIASFVFIITMIVLKKTALGLFIESIGCNSVSSKIAGINVNKIKFLTYVFSGLCAGIAGLLIASNVKSADANNAGLFMELDGILAVVIGGTSLKGGRFYLPGSIVGAITIQCLTTTMYSIGVSPYVMTFVKSLVIIGIFFIQSEEIKALIKNRNNIKKKEEVVKEIKVQEDSL